MSLARLGMSLVMAFQLGSLCLGIALPGCAETSSTTSGEATPWNPASAEELIRTRRTYSRGCHSDNDAASSTPSTDGASLGGNPPQLEPRIEPQAPSFPNPAEKL